MSHQRQDLRYIAVQHSFPGPRTEGTSVVTSSQGASDTGHQYPLTSGDRVIEDDGIRTAVGAGQNFSDSSGTQHLATAGRISTLTSGAGEGAWTNPATPNLSRAPSTHINNMYGSIDGMGPKNGLALSGPDSRTHVPSLNPRAFLQPMSSQTLQVQRGQRPFQQQEPQAHAYSDYGDADSTTNTRRTSHGSGLNGQGDIPPPLPSDVAAMPPLPLTLSQVDGSGDERDVVSGEAQADRAVSLPYHTSLENLQQPQGRQTIARKNSPRSYPDGTDPTARGRSPRMIVANLRQQASTRGTEWNNAHEKLASRETLPEPDIDHKLPQTPKEDVGFNYQYFSGNTVFFWGGRLQNTRSRPISLLTALLVVAPAVLFFIFS